MSYFKGEHHSFAARTDASQLIIYLLIMLLLLSVYLKKLISLEILFHTNKRKYKLTR